MLDTTDITTELTDIYCFNLKNGHTRGFNQDAGPPAWCLYKIISEA